MAERFLRNKIFELNGKVKQEILATAIGIKFAPLMQTFTWMRSRQNF